MQVKKQQIELDMEQKTGFKLGKKYIKAVYCHPAYLTYMQNISCEMPYAEYIMWNAELDEAEGGITFSNLRYADDNTLMVESEEELKSFLMKGKEESGWLFKKLT